MTPNPSTDESTVYGHLLANVGWLNTSNGSLHSSDGEQLMGDEGLVAPILEVLAALGIDPNARHDRVRVLPIGATIMRPLTTAEIAEDHNSGW